LDSRDSQVNAGKATGNLVQINEAEVREHLGELVRGSVEETLNALLDQEADQVCRATRYERTPERQDTRAGSYQRKLQTQAGEVTLMASPENRYQPLG
jgi:transposase-like protein